MKKIFKSKLINLLLSSFFSLFYDRQYLKGYFFDERIVGWIWAWRGIGKNKRQNKDVPWPISSTTVVVGAKNIKFDLSSLNIFQTPGGYWQAIDATITVGKNCYVAPNVGIITTNHDSNNPHNHVKGKSIFIGDNCWIGMNAVILPGVVLGNNTVVAAGAVVTKSVPQGHCTVAGVPARIISTRN